MIPPMGDNASTYIPSHPIRTNSNVSNGSMPWKITRFSGNALYWILQICALILSVSVNILCNPIVWFLMKTIFNVLTEVFVYLVLGVCSVMISFITSIDEYYTKGKRNQSNDAKIRDGLQIQSCTVKRFVERPSQY